MSSYTKKNSARRSDDTMDDDGEDKDDTKRKSRNLSEKKRRDQFNMLVNELSSMVSTGARKMDKSTVLRSTISFLKNHNEIAIRSRAHEIQEDWKPAFLSNEEFTHLILEALDGFIVVFSAAGHVHYVSESVTALLGHLPSELLNTSVYELVWNEEQAALYQALSGGNSGNGPGGGALAFQAHLRRARPHPNLDTYELVNFQGYLRTDIDMFDSTSGTASDTRFSGYSGEADTRLFVGTGRLHTPQLIREMSLVDAADMAASGGSHSGRGPPGEFTSRHSLEWKFLFLDHRAPPIIGYLPFEVLGTSGYDYYHVDDLDKVVSCHEALMQKGEGTSCFYRFLTKGQQWIWLQTRFYITYHQWNSKPEFIVCTHRVVSYVDVMKQTRKDTHQQQQPASQSVATSDTALVDTSPVPGSGVSSPWGGASSHRSTKASGGRQPQRSNTGPPSDCTSMSADSPASRQSQTQQPGRSSRLSSHNTVTGPPNAGPIPGPVPVSGPNSTLGPAPGPSGPVIFAEPPQPFVAAIPVQPAVVTAFPPPTAAVLSPLPQAVESVPLVAETNPPASQLQAQLQRKHAELQAIIGQQQAELRRVSEQLLMARLGILTPQAPPPHPHQQQPQQQHGTVPVGHQQQHTLLTAVTVPYVCNSNVSSTTSASTGPTTLQVPEDASILGLGRHQSQLLYSQPSSSTSHLPK